MKFSRDEASLESDWGRVSQNPDNLIVSDSLKVLLNPEQIAPSTELCKSISFPAKLNFSGKEINAVLYAYASLGDETRYSFKIKAQELGIVLGSGELKSLFITDSLESFNCSIELLPNDERPEISFELLSSPSVDANLNIKIFK